MLAYMGNLYVLGGSDYVLNFKDLYKFSLKSCAWSKRDVGDFDPRCDLSAFPLSPQSKFSYYL